MPKNKESIYERLQRGKATATEASLYIKGPKEIIERFRKYQKKHKFKNAWGLLEHLMNVEKQARKK